MGSHFVVGRPGFHPGLLAGVLSHENPESAVHPGERPA